MPRLRSIAFTFALALSLGLAAALAADGCSKNKTTNPMTTTNNNTTDTFNSGTLSTAGQTFTHTFNTAGSFGYYCSFHGTPTTGMRGTVVVDASSSNTSGAASVGPGATTTFSPASVTIKPGSTVTWTLSAGSHTVTR